MAGYVTVVFTNGHDLDNYILRKIVRWAELNIDDLVCWMRKSPIIRLPDGDYSSKSEALRRLKFMYNSTNLTAACTNLALTNREDIAAIVVEITIDETTSNFGTLLAALSHFTRQNSARAIVSVNTKQENIQPNIDEWEEFDGLDKTIEESENDEKLKKFQMISTIYSSDIYLFDGIEFMKKL